MATISGNDKDASSNKLDTRFGHVFPHTRVDNTRVQSTDLNYRLIGYCENEIKSNKSRLAHVRQGITCALHYMLVGPSTTSCMQSRSFDMRSIVFLFEGEWRALGTFSGNW